MFLSQLISQHIQLNTACQQLLCTVKFNFQELLSVQIKCWIHCFYLMQLSDALLHKRLVMQRPGIFNLLSSSKPWHDAVARHAGPAGAADIWNKHLNVFFDEYGITLMKNTVCVPGPKEAGSPLRSHRIWLRYAEFTKRRLFTENRNKTSNISQVEIER